MASKDEVLNVVLKVLEDNMAPSAREFYERPMSYALSALEWGNETPSLPPGTLTVERALEMVEEVFKEWFKSEYMWFKIFADKLRAMETAQRDSAKPSAKPSQFSLDHPRGHQLRDGRKAEVWKVADGKIWGRFKRYDDVWIATSWDLNGRRVGEGQESTIDLINAPDPTPRVCVKRWVNIDKTNGTIYVYDSPYDAEKAVGSYKDFFRTSAPVEIREIVEGDE